jgi:hypothetical protein
MSLQSYIDQFRMALEKILDFGLSESFDFKQEIRPGKQAIINAEVILIKEHKHQEDGSVVASSMPEPSILIDEVIETF